MKTKLSRYFYMITPTEEHGSMSDGQGTHEGAAAVCCFIDVPLAKIALQT